MIRILHYGLDSHLGGIETYIYKLYNNINKNEFKFDFLTIGKEEVCFYKEFKEMGSDFYSITPRSSNPVKNRLELSKVLKSGKYDIVHCHMNTLSYIAPIKVALKNNSAVLLHSRNAGAPKSILTNILHTINSWFLPRKRIEMVSVSDLAGYWLFGKDAKFTVINNGIDIDKFTFRESSRRRIRKELGIEDEVVILNVGALRQQKNHMFLLDVYKEVTKKHNKTKLILVGDGRLKQDILQKIKLLEIEDNVILLGRRDDIPEILSSADVFLFPSFYEGFPNAVLEAETSGLPCLISDVITKEVIINENCHAMSLDNSVDEWASKLLALKGFKDRKIGAKNIKMKGFSVEDEVRKIEEIYRKMANRAQILRDEPVLSNH